MARADVDHNGRLDIREFIRMMHNYNTEMADPKAEDLQRTREIMEAFRCRRDRHVQMNTSIYNIKHKYILFAGLLTDKGMEGLQSRMLNYFLDTLGIFALSQR